MAGSSEDRWRRPSHGDPRADEPEEGEFVPGYHSDVDTEEYYNRHCSPSDSDETIRDSNAACSVVPACCYVGDATSSLPVAVNSHSPDNGGEASSSSSVAAPAVLPCPVCGKVFRGQKAVCGHMKVHALGIGRQQQQEQGNGKGKAGIKRDVAAAFVGACWGGTGKRGCSGLGARAATPNAESDQSTMDIVVAEPNIVFQPMPLAFAPPNLSSVHMASATPIASAAPDLSTLDVTTISVSGQLSTSAQPMPNDAMDRVVAGAADPASDAVAHPHAAPPPAAEGEQSLPVHQPRIAPAAAGGRQNPNGYRCDQCDLWFSTHQALGGHKAGHKSREVAAAAVAAGALEYGGAAPCGRNARPEKAHVCKVCGAVFPAGVQLGGHMRKHYTGPPIVPNKKRRLSFQFQQPLLPPPVLTLAPPVNADGASPAPAVEAAAPQPGPTPEVEVRTPEPASRPAVPTRVLLFGIDIGVGARQKPAAQEEGSASSGGGEH